METCSGESQLGGEYNDDYFCHDALVVVHRSSRVEFKLFAAARVIVNLRDVSQVGVSAMFSQFGATVRRMTGRGLLPVVVSTDQSFGRPLRSGHWAVMCTDRRHSSAYKCVGD